MLLLASQTLLAAPEYAGDVRPAGVIASTATGWSYPIQVYLPPGYDDSEKRYPVFYAVDAEIRLKRIIPLLEEQQAEAIVVGINNTGDTRREYDFQMPGAENYARFLSNELVPYIDARYRTNPEQRALGGHSMGGLVSALVMLLEDPINRQFDTFLISDGSFWSKPDVTRALIAELKTSDPQLPVTVFTTGATDGNIRGARMFYNEINNAGFEQLNLIYRVYETNHKEAFWPSFTEGLAELY